MCLWPWSVWACGECGVWCGCWAWCVLGVSVVGLWLVVAGGVWVGCDLCEMGMWVSVVSVMWSVWVGGGGVGALDLVFGCWAGVVVWLCVGVGGGCAGDWVCVCVAVG